MGASFDKGNGVKSLDRKLKLRVEEGPNIVCGDTDSDVKMIEATLALMCGEPMLKGWLWQMELEEAQEKGEPEPEHLDPDPFEDTEELQRAREAGKKLIVLFVVSRGEHVRKPKLAQRVRRLCELAGAQCAILPSPDVLVASLAMYANIVTRAMPTPFGICSALPMWSDPTGLGAPPSVCRGAGSAASRNMTDAWQKVGLGARPVSVDSNPIKFRDGLAIRRTVSWARGQRLLFVEGTRDCCETISAQMLTSSLI